MVTKRPKYHLPPGAAGHKELAITVEGVGLEDPEEPSQMLPWMLALAVAGVIEHRRRRGCPPKGQSSGT